MRTLLSFFAALFLAVGCMPASSQNHQMMSLSSQDDALTILSFNMRWWTRDRESDSPVYWKKRMAAMEKMILDVDPDVICFQEYLAPAGSYVPSSYKRVGVTASHPIFIKRSLKASKHEVAVFWDRCVVDGINIFCVHTRWENDLLLKAVGQINERLTGTDVACGDWNNGLGTMKNSGLKMESAREQLGVDEIDTFANYKRPEQSHGAIDHFFVTGGVKALSYSMITDGYGCSSMSDHYPILLRVAKKP